MEAVAEGSGHEATHASTREAVETPEASGNSHIAADAEAPSIPGTTPTEAPEIEPATVPKTTLASESPASMDDSLRFVPLPPGWEGLSIKLYGDRCIISEVPKACFSSRSFAVSGALKNQVEGVSVGDEVATLNGETPARLMERITTAGDAWNACSVANPPHAVGSKTKFDSPPCVACDFIRRRKQLGFDVALPMWLRAVKREIKFTLGVKPGSLADLPEGGDAGASVLNTMALKCDSSGSEKPKMRASLDSELGTSSVVELKASEASVNKMEDALERLKKLAALDDLTRDKHRKNKGGKGKDKGKGKGKRPTGPDLPRTRLTDSLVTGEVVEWKGKYGWIKPHTPVDHPKAGVHKGRLYVHLVDLEWWVKALTPGSFCRFHVYSDANSLGAEECTELKDASSSGDADYDSSSWKDGTSNRSRSPYDQKR